MLQTPGDEPGARARAVEYGLLNSVRGQGAIVLDEDIDVILDSSKVRVRVNNCQGSRYRNTRHSSPERFWGAGM